MESLLKKHEWKYVNSIASPFGDDGPTNLNINYFGSRTHYNVYNGKTGNHVQCDSEVEHALFEFEEYDTNWRRYRQ